MREVQFSVFSHSVKKYPVPVFVGFQGEKSLSSLSELRNLEKSLGCMVRLSERAADRDPCRDDRPLPDGVHLRVELV